MISKIFISNWFEKGFWRGKEWFGFKDTGTFPLVPIFVLLSISRIFVLGRNRGAVLSKSRAGLKAATKNGVLITMV